MCRSIIRLIVVRFVNKNSKLGAGRETKYSFAGETEYDNIIHMVIKKIGKTEKRLRDVDVS